MLEKYSATLAGSWARTSCCEKLARQNQDGRLVIAPPTMVLSAFAAELFLKCLLVLEGGTILSTHRLDVLFKRVSHKRQRKIQELWEADGHLS